MLWFLFMFSSFSCKYNYCKYIYIYYTYCSANKDVNELGLEGRAHLNSCLGALWHVLSNEDVVSNLSENSQAEPKYLADILGSLPGISSLSPRHQWIVQDIPGGTRTFDKLTIESDVGALAPSGSIFVGCAGPCVLSLDGSKIKWIQLNQKNQLSKSWNVGHGPGQTSSQFSFSKPGFSWWHGTPTCTRTAGNFLEAVCFPKRLGPGQQKRILFLSHLQACAYLRHWHALAFFFELFWLKKMRNSLSSFRVRL